MSAVDSPPGIAFAGLAAGEFAARKRSKRLATLCFAYVAVCGVSALLLAARHPFAAGVEVVIVMPLVCLSIAGVGLAVRRATIRIDKAGIRWGWVGASVRMKPARIARVIAYDDAIALKPKRGSTWFLSSRDWEGFTGALRALQRAEIEHEKKDGRAPWRARLQSYGRALDGLMILSCIIVTYVLLAAMSL